MHAACAACTVFQGFWRGVVPGLKPGPTAGSPYGDWFAGGFVRDDGVRPAAACPEGHWFLHKECPCTVPMGLRNELGESHFPTLKRGANELCASGAVVGTFITQSSIKPASPLRFAVAPFDKFRAGSLPNGRRPVRGDPGSSTPRTKTCRWGPRLLGGTGEGGSLFNHRTQRCCNLGVDR